jgi:hypothetical protein
MRHYKQKHKGEAPAAVILAHIVAVFSFIVCSDQGP